MLAILDYNAGNQTSVMRALEYLGISCKITNSGADLDSCDGIIFPGVGSARQAMGQLRASGLDAAILRAVQKGQPLLGICLGCQILLEMSEEENCPTLGLCRGNTVRFPANMKQEDGTPARIPHMGWNRLNIERQSEILRGIGEDDEFYFVHGYYARPDPELVIATTRHGMEFCSIYGAPGFWAAQFHPEKSGRPGLRFLANFNHYCQERANAV